MKKYGFIDLDKNISKEDILAEWYHKVLFVVRKVKLPLDKEDLVQELMLHLFEVSEKFRLGKSAFNTFAWTCLRNKIRTLIKQSKRKEFLIIGDSFLWDNVDFDLDCRRVKLNRKQKYVFWALNKGYRRTEIASRLKITESRVTGLVNELKSKTPIKEILNA